MNGFIKKELTKVKNTINSSAVSDVLFLRRVTKHL